MTLMPQDDIERFAHDFIVAHPDATTSDVFDAIRATGYTGLLQSFQVHHACQKVRPIPTLTTVDETVAVMNGLASRREWISVFWDRGWGDNGEVAEISIIADGDGQAPVAWLTRDVYDRLIERQIISPNSLQTFKARRLHDFNVSAPDSSSGDTAGVRSPDGGTIKMED